MLTHGNVCAALGGFALQNTEVTEDQEVYLSYLPLAHIMERVGVYRIASLGGKIGIYSGV
jgi:long-chain acyl-CoA synthetase